MLRTRLIRDDESGDYLPFAGYKSNLGKTYTKTKLLFPNPIRELQANTSLDQKEGY